MLLGKLLYYRTVNRNQWTNFTRLNALQLKLLRQILGHAYEHVPYYKEEWRNIGFNPLSFKRFEDLSKIPFTDKNIVLDNYNDFFADNISKTEYKRSTSGSTGRKLEAHFDEESYDYLEAVYLRALRAVGYKPWKPLAYYWYKTLKKKWYNYFFMRKPLILCWLSEEDQLKRLKELNPPYIYYYGAVLYTLSKYIIGMGYELKIKPKAIITHAELLTPGMRSIIEKAFGCKVYNQYGTTEFNRMGWECLKREGYHTDTDSTYIEFDDFGYKAKEIVATGLINYQMPFIRYRMGDLAMGTGQCSCGRVLPLIKRIYGRKKNLFRLKGGVFSDYELIDSIADIVDLLNFRISKSDNGLVIKYIPNHNFKSIGIRMARKRLKDLTKADVEFEEVDKLKCGSGGKLSLIEAQYS